MIRFTLILALILSFHFSKSQIHFTNISRDTITFQRILKGAEKQNKLILMYFTADWCGWCKVFEREILTDSIVRNYYKKNFINTKVSWDDNVDHLDIDELVKMAPQFIIINYKRDTLNRCIGYVDVEDFLKFGKQANSVDDNLLVWKEKIENGDYSYDVVSKRINSLKPPHAYLPPDQECEPLRIFNKYFDTISEDKWMSVKNWALIQKCVINPNNNQYKYILKNYSEFVEKYGKVEIDKFFFDVWYKYTSMHYEVASKELKNQAFPPVKALQREFDIWSLKDQIDKSCGTLKDSLVNKLAELSKEAYTNHYYLYSSSSINNITWFLYQYCERTDNSELLLDACEWMDKLITTTEYFEVFDTYSHILSALQENKRALELEEKALELAKWSHENKETIDRINQRIEALRKYN
ncbi:thioredoxin family protein [Marinifilum sp.]|uniref:thioredoxin family protein n=1 Tax=Marinifilum sp. TaxID=2033137 RepID=UPI003BA8D278